MFTGFTSGGLDGNNNAGGRDFFLVKYNSDGVKQWTRQMGTVVDEEAFGVSADSEGNAYVTGFTRGNLDGNTSAGGRDLFLVKYNNDGLKQWTQQLGTTIDDWAFDVSVDDDGNTYVTGFSWGNLDGNTNAGGYDIFLVKYDSSGVKQWTRLVGTAAYDEGRGVSVDSNGNAYVTGFTWGHLDGNTNAGGCDVFLVKYNSGGVLQ